MCASRIDGTRLCIVETGCAHKDAENFKDMVGTSCRPASHNIIVANRNVLVEPGNYVVSEVR